MFGTSIHWTTFFLLLVDTAFFIIALFQSSKLKHNDLNSYLMLAFLFMLYNGTGGFLPYEGFPGPFILQYVITYGVAITMGIYLFHYIYREYDIRILDRQLTITNLSVYGALCFFGLFLFPYYLTGSLDIARKAFTMPVSLVCLYFLWAFHYRISRSKRQSPFVVRRNRLALLSVACMVLLPILTVIGDYQWLTFPIVNTSFFAISAIEIDRYHYFLRNKRKMSEVFSYYKKSNGQVAPKFFKKGLTRREIEIAMSILDGRTYKQIGEDFFIAESTVSKHASNIFKKTEVANKSEFLMRFRPKKSRTDKR